LKTLKKIIREFLSKSLLFLGELFLLASYKKTIYRYHAYQPLPELKMSPRKRGDSTISRWEAIEKCLTTDMKSAKDVGANLGYFLFRLQEKGIFALGVESEQKPVEISQLAQRKFQLEGLAFSKLVVAPKNIKSLPTTDITISTAVWHHWIRDYGYEEALKMLGSLWNSTQKIMFFESGEDSEIYSLDIKKPPGDWVREQLEKICNDSKIIELGKFKGADNKKNNLKRSLFAVYRN
jgi:hypothetical protein